MSNSSGSRPLRIGIDLLWLGARAGGVGRYAGELPGALLEAEPASDVTLFVGRDVPSELRRRSWADAVRWVPLPFGSGTAPAQLAEHLLLPGLAAVRRLDVLHSPGNVGPVITPGRASVVSLMDLIWLVHAEEWNPDPRVQRAMRRQVAWSVRHADRVLAISETAAGDITRGLGIARERIAVTPLGVRASDVSPAPAADLRARLDLTGRRVVLCVSQKRRYKNLALIIRALPLLPADVVAVMPGSPTAYEDELRALATQLDVSQRVRFPDWVSEAELVGLYRLASAFAFPTLTEGFGLPVLEAMAHGLPVACSDLPVLREVAGDAALLFDSHDPAALAGALTRVLADSGVHAQLRQAGIARAREFTWRRTGAATLTAYRQAIAARNAT